MLNIIRVFVHVVRSVVATHVVNRCFDVAEHFSAVLVVTTNVWTQVAVFSALELNTKSWNRHTNKCVVKHLIVGCIVVEDDNVLVTINVRLDATKVDKVVHGWVSVINHNVVDHDWANFQVSLTILAEHHYSAFWNRTTVLVVHQNFSAVERVATSKDISQNTSWSVDP
ncbi:hypothetical protein D3C75_606860 [compost metagenome]